MASTISPVPIDDEKKALLKLHLHFVSKGLIKWTLLVCPHLSFIEDLFIFPDRSVKNKNFSINQ